MKRCKHDFGWCVKENPCIFTDSDGKVVIDFQYGKKGGAKLVAICNRRDCGAYRNIYIKGEVVKMGRIHKKKD